MSCIPYNDYLKLEQQYKDCKDDVVQLQEALNDTEQQYEDAKHDLAIAEDQMKDLENHWKRVDKEIGDVKHWVQRIEGECLTMLNQVADPNSPLAHSLPQFMAVWRNFAKQLKAFDSYQ